MSSNLTVSSSLSLLPTLIYVQDAVQIPTMVVVKMVHITKEQQKILHYLAANGTSTGYDLQKAGRFTAKVYPYLSELRKKGYVSLVKKETTGRGKKRYALTTLGASYVLVALRGKEKNIQRLRETHGEILPLVLGTWDILMQIDSDTCHAALDRAAYEVAFRRRNPLLNFSPVPEDFSSSDDEIFSFEFYRSILFDAPNESDFLTQIVDEKIRTFLIRILNYYIDFYRISMERFDEKRRILESKP